MVLESYARVEEEEDDEDDEDDEDAVVGGHR
jgi:hypothetical protein